jgi:hypothetical protein
MATPQLHTQKRGNGIALWAIVVVIAGIVFYGIWLFLSSQKHVPTHPPGAVLHSTPVGGRVQDGVFHPTELTPDSEATRWRI